jgi:hypothetical protein
MVRKFVDLEEAAKMLGVTPDTLGEMRERRQVFGYRDGATWKFKLEDIERLATERAAVEEEGEFAELDEDPDSILLSEVELGGSNESTSSTIIGGRADAKDAADSDIQLARPKNDSDLDLGNELGDIKAGSGVLEGGGSGSGVSPLFDDLDTLDLEMPSAADSGISSNVPLGLADSKAGPAPDPAKSDVALAPEAQASEGSGLVLGGEEELSLGSDSGLEMSEPGEGGSAIDLSEDVDDDLVLGGSSHGDLSRSGDSGISLLDPADSGLSLESPPLELGGSAVESLELGEEDMLLADEPAAKTVVKGAAAEPAADDDFLLTPPDEAGAEESDSGSQVIAVEDDVTFDEAAISGIGSESGLGGMLDEGLGDDLGEGLGAAAELSAAALTPAAAPAAGAATAPMIGPAGVYRAAEPPFSGWNVASLIVCSLLLMICGMFTFDLMRSMWSWNQPYAVNSTMMNIILSMFEK